VSELVELAAGGKLFARVGVAIDILFITMARCTYHGSILAALWVNAATDESIGTH
jgi:hypothetical protein